MIMNSINHILKINLRPLFVAVLAALAAILPIGADARDIFAELAESNDPFVDCTYISSRFAHNKPYWRSRDGMHSLNLSDGFSSMYIYQCSSVESVAKGAAILKKYLKENPNLELVMRQNSGASKYEIYELFGEDNKIYKLIIWSSDAKNVAEIVVIDWEKGYSRDDESYSRTFSPFVPSEDAMIILSQMLCNND